MESNGGYLLPNQTLEERIQIIGDYASKILNKPDFSEKFMKNMEKGWYSLSTPIWCNFGADRGLGISCFGTHIEDTMESILYTLAEIGTMSKIGGGTAGYFGELRPRGSEIKNNGTSHGSVHFMRLFDNITNIVSQGNSRRGHFAAYLPIDHADIEEFLTIKEEGSPIQDISFAVCVTRQWITEMRNGDVDKRKTWAKVLQRRSEVGYPYIFFTDNVNDGAPEVYKDKGLKINHSQMCSEITLSTTKDESFVCDLSSMNIAKYDEWKNDEEAIEILVYLLDAVMTDFIEKASNIKFMERAVRFAKNQRAIGIGQLGWHSYLQSKMIPFESMEAKLLNAEIAITMKEKAYAASAKLAKEYGEPELMKGYGRRNSTLLAIAPTTSSAFILGQVSQSIEPWNSNYFVKDLAKIKYTVKNEHLEKLLEEKGMNNKETWMSILMHGGSVQHLSFLTKHEKDVFKTFGEISQKEIIIQAAQRQKYIDQAQSLNLMIHPATPTKDINELLLFAHDNGIKTLYYQHSTNAAQEFSRDILNCVNCE
jgi:ribonucleoside-diphosphate reductase alpha chain